LLGTLLIIGLFSVIIWRSYAIGTGAERRQDRFAAYVAYGLGLWLGMQAFVNIGVNVGLLPTKGLTLPFISYGSNSLIVCCMAIGMLMRINRETLSAGHGRESGWQRV
jgi:cell division protein FtsW